MYNQNDRCICINSSRFSAEVWVLPRLAFGSNPVSDIHRKNPQNLNLTVQFGKRGIASLDLADSCGSGPQHGPGQRLIVPARKGRGAGVRECTYLNVPLTGDRKGTVGTPADCCTVDAKNLASLHAFFFFGKLWQMFSSG